MAKTNPSDRVSRIVATLRTSVKAELGWPASEFDPLWEGARPMIRNAVQEKFGDETEGETQPTESEYLAEFTRLLSEVADEERQNNPLPADWRDQV